jgi:hypothetical protein
MLTPEIEELLLKVGEYVSLYDETIDAVMRQDEGHVERLRAAYAAMRSCYESVSADALESMAG